MSLSVTGRGHTIWEAAKQEWTKHICNLLVPVIEEGFRNIYANCAKSVQVTEDPEDEDATVTAPMVGAISKFKETLLDIPKWNQEIIDQEFDRILNNDDCREVLDDLVKAAFTSHILILTSVNLSGQTNKKVEMNIPSSKRFVHKIYIEAARVFYRNPHLFVTFFNDAETEYRYHKNGSRIEQVLCASVEEAIRKLMPIRAILRAYMSASGDGAPPVDTGALQEVEDITRRVSPRSRRGLRDILKSYIKTTSEVIHRDAEEEDRAHGTGKLKELPWHSDDEEEENADTGDDDDEETRSKVEDEDDIIVESVARGNSRRDSLLTRRTSPQRSPRPRYRSPPIQKRHNRHTRDHRDEDRRSHRDRDRDRGGGGRRSRRHPSDDRRPRRRRRERDDRDDRDDRRSRRRRRERDDRDEDRRRDRKHRSSSRRDRDDEDKSRKSRDKKGRFEAQTQAEDEYAFDLLTSPDSHATSGDKKRKTSKTGKTKGNKSKAADEPSINIEKRPSRSSRSSRPQSVEFRLERSDEDGNEIDDNEKPKKHVTYKAHDRDQAFFPELNDDNRSEAPSRNLPPTDGYHSE